MSDVSFDLIAKPSTIVIPTITPPSPPTITLAQGHFEANEWSLFNTVCCIGEDTPDSVSPSYQETMGNFRSTAGYRTRFFYYAQIPETCSLFKIGISHWGNFAEDVHIRAYDVTHLWIHQGYSGNTTWNQYYKDQYGGVDWPTPGGDLGEVLGDAYGIDQENGPDYTKYLTIDLTDAAQDWLDGYARGFAMPICLTNEGPNILPSVAFYHSLVS